MTSVPDSKSTPAAAFSNGEGISLLPQIVSQHMEAQLKSRLKERARSVIQDGNLKHAAVLLPLLNRDGEYHILFIKRSQRVEDHKGEISFPGGICEKDDGSLERTALREAFEEIGIRPDDVSVLGMLDDIRTLSTRYRVTPVVGAIPYPYLFAVCANEVEEIITIPFTHLLNPSSGREKSVIRDGQTYPGYVYHYKNHMIWGATARILKNFFRLWNDLSPAPGTGSSLL